MEVFNILNELSKHSEGTFLTLSEFNGNHFGSCDITGESPVWEMHPDTDEFFYIIEGEFEVLLLDGPEPSKVSVSAGCCFVIPKGIWHKPAAPEGCKFVYFTPGKSLHSESTDPREVTR
ncbi:cupin domain-containing protein [Pseudoalteromonas sp. T1lg65]|uniref:cupin domain-containing protein n=1 Tax=Pseudoalteromonas sp. T1lg65 TaxID=2077101 RepID=UPI003F792F09